MENSTVLPAQVCMQKGEIRTRFAKKRKLAKQILDWFSTTKPDSARLERPAMAKLGTPSASQAQAASPSSAKASASKELPSPAPLPPPSPGVTGAASESDQHPFVVELQQQRDAYLAAQKKYLLYSRGLCTAALFFALLLLLMELFAESPAAAALHAMGNAMASLNPFHRGIQVPAGSGLFRKLVALINIVLVGGLTTVGDMQATAGRNQEVAAKFTLLVDSAVAAGGAEDKLKPLQGEREAIEAEAAQKQLVMGDPIAACLSSLLGAKLFIKGYIAARAKVGRPLAPEESQRLLAQDAARSDDLEAGLLGDVMGSLPVEIGTPGQAAAEEAGAAGGKAAKDESSYKDSDEDEPPSDDEGSKSPAKSKGGKDIKQDV